MLGPGKYSESSWTPWAAIATSFVRKLAYNIEVAWKRTFDSSLTYARVGAGYSQINGLHIVQGPTTPSTNPDLFETWDMSDRVLSIEYDRKISEPLGGITTCLAEIELANYDNLLTPNYDADLGTALLPKRPVMADIGFVVEGADKNVVVFKGLSEMPMESKMTGKLLLPAQDYVAYLNDYSLEPAVYEDKRVDEIIEDILKLAGFQAASYELDEALNTPEIAYFTADQTAGERIRLLCESEEAHFFQDAEAVLRFQTRRKYGEYPYNQSLWDLDPEDIISWEVLNNIPIINKCNVRVSPRVQQSLQKIWTLDEEIDFAISEEKTIDITLEDPCTIISYPSTDDYSFVSSGDIEHKGDLDFSFQLKGKELSLTLTNLSSAFTRTLKSLILYGKPTILSGEFTESYEDSTSVNKFDSHEYTIDNPYIEDEASAQSLAQHIVKKYKDPLTRIRLTIQGQPHFEVKDQIRAKDPTTNVYTNYRIMQIQGTLSNGVFLQDIVVRELGDNEYDS